MIIAGIDEVGRGCWAGPVVAGAVVLEQPIDGLRDSKKLSKHQREKLSLLIFEQARAATLGWVSAAEVNELGLTASVGLAMQRAMEQITTDIDQIIIDGNYNYLADDPRATTRIKADDSVPAVAAASIIAKVARDTYMAETAHEQFSAYGFDQHVGYGTAKHRAALEQFGVCAEHREFYKPVRRIMEAM